MNKNEKRLWDIIDIMMDFVLRGQKDYGNSANYYDDLIDKLVEEGHMEIEDMGSDCQVPDWSFR